MKKETGGIKIFLDDIRCPSDCVSYMYDRIGDKNPIYLKGGWLIVRNYQEFVEMVVRYQNDITHISFDHDLAEEHLVPQEEWEIYEKDIAYQVQKHSLYRERTGYDCAKWMKEYYEMTGINFPEMYVHSQNPIGLKRIVELFK